MRAHAFYLAVLAAIPACGDDPQTAGQNLGVLGASCVRTPDCRAPLQCIELVCSDGAADAPDASDASSEPDTIYMIDGTNPFEDEVHADIVTAYDVSDWDFDAPDTSAPDTETADALIPTDDCGELGIASSWAGTFVGSIDYTVTPNPLTPSAGTLPVNGALTFDIACIQNKFILHGQMTGTATVEGQGDFPFELTIQGTYDPQHKTMNAKLVDGSVSIYGLVIVYFEGDFTGSILEDTLFHGAWSGHSTGTNQQLITGEAAGDGLWSAAGE